MKINCFEKPLKLYGLNHINAEAGEFWRLPREIIEKMPQYELLGKRCCGGRLRFKTDSAKIKIRYVLSTEQIDWAMALPAAAGIDIYVGKGMGSRFAGFVAPVEYGYKGKLIEGVITIKDKAKSEMKDEMQMVTINLPRNESIASIEVEIDDGATIETPDKYAVSKPIVFYGSSITEGGCAPRPGTSYTSITTRWLDADYFNYGLSGSAKGERAFAEFIAAHENMSLFVYDYDHNAPTWEHLDKTHEPFLKIIRDMHPDLPVVMLSRPDFDMHYEDSVKRRSVIYKTYMHYVERGDRNIYFVDGESLFGFYGREECTIDGCHPTGLGFMRMVETVYPLVKNILSKEQN